MKMSYKKICKQGMFYFKYPEQYYLLLMYSNNNTGIHHNFDNRADNTIDDFDEYWRDTGGWPSYTNIFVEEDDVE